ncbi:MAG: glycoside hydrolase family 88 protein [Bacteroidota bacterium]
MKRIVLVCSALLLLSLSASAQPDRTLPLKTVINNALDNSIRQSMRLALMLKDRPGLLPRSTDSTGTLVTCTSKWWTSGFFPGTLWYLFEYSKNDSLKRFAEEFTRRVTNEQFTTDNHDVGFMINNSFGNAYRITGDTMYRSALLNASRSLMTRFNPVVGATRSWNTDKNNRQWQFAVIIDNMMNLELLLRSADEFNEPTFKTAALSHADKTLQHHFRPDHSSYHVVSYDTITGLPHAKQTAQGFLDSSSWSRGQAWGLYGFTMMYRLTKEKRYLDQAQHIADFILHHPNLPADKIPYWDFNAPNIPNTYRDASAGAIICSALIELSGYVSPKKMMEYRGVAERQIRTLSSAQFKNISKRNAPFILDHSVGSIPHRSEIDVPLTYADYYFVESLLRMRALTNIKQ